jgi:hypothetical protein
MELFRKLGSKSLRPWPTSWLRDRGTGPHGTWKRRSPDLWYRVKTSLWLYRPTRLSKHANMTGGIMRSLCLDVAGLTACFVGLEEHAQQSGYPKAATAMSLWWRGLTDPPHHVRLRISGSCRPLASLRPLESKYCAWKVLLAEVRLLGHVHEGFICSVIWKMRTMAMPELSTSFSTASQV